MQPSQGELSTENLEGATSCNDLKAQASSLPPMRLMTSNSNLCSVDAVSVLPRAALVNIIVEPKICSCQGKPPVTRQNLPCCSRRTLTIGLQYVSKRSMDCKKAGFRDLASATVTLIGRNTASAGPLELFCPQTEPGHRCKASQVSQVVKHAFHAMALELPCESCQSRIVKETTRSQCVQAATL